MCSLKIEYKFAYDNWNCIAVFNCPPSSVLCPLTKSFLWGANGELTAVSVPSVSSVSSVYLPAYDGNRNITAYIDASDGNIAASYEYSPSGGTISKSGPEADNMTFGFASYYLDPETNLIYYGYRYYSPETGRFVNRDPIEESGGVGLYVYGNNDLINNWDYLGLILAAVDGTSSRDYLKTATRTTTGRRRSHISNFHSDCSDKKKRYWHGPDNAKTGSDAPKIHKEVYEWICKHWCQNREVPIDMVGHSRGGFIVLTVSWQLKNEGCCCDKGTQNEKQYNPVSVRFLGLYDAVDMVDGYGESEAIPDNVVNAAQAMGNPDLKSRWYFNTADGGVEDPSRTNYSEQEFWGTHAAIGGAPWDGDHPKGGSEDLDIFNAVLADQLVRGKAIEAGLEIQSLKRADYGY